MRYKEIACLLVGLALSQNSLAEVPLAVDAHYKVYKAGIQVAEVTEQFSRDKYNYQLSSKTRPVGLLSAFLSGHKLDLTSKGIIGLQGLKPQVFSQKNTKEPEKNSEATLDWSNKKITMSHKGKQKIADLPELTQDRISAMYQMMYWSFTRDMDTLSFPMTNGRKLDNYDFGIVPNQVIKLSGIEKQTTYLYYTSDKGNKTEVWLCNKDHNFPCKIVLTDEDGDALSQELTKVKFTVAAKTP